MGLRHFVDSLRGRYVAAALVLTLLTVICIAWAGREVAMTGRDSTARIESRNRVQRLSLEMRDALSTTDFALYAHLLAPTAPLRRAVDDGLNRALEHVQTLAAIEWAQTAGRQGLLSRLREDMLKLREVAHQLMSVRVDRDKRFPSMSTIVGSLYPANTAFFTAIALALEELQSSRANPNESEEYELFVEIRRLWSRMISSFRTFIAYRTGTIGDPDTGMSKQIANIDLLYQAVKTSLRRLGELEARGRLGLQGEESLKDMRRIAADWYSAYQGVSRIQASQQWRRDIPLFHQYVQPLATQIREHLRTLDTQIEASVTQDMGVLTRLARRIVSTLWILGAIVLLFIAAGYYFLERGVLAPISQVAKGLKAKAWGGDTPPLCRTGIEEIRDLTGAFNTLAESLSSAEHHREQAEAVARQAAKMSIVGELAACVAHEINNPLNNVMRLTEFMERDLEDEPRGDGLREDMKVLRQELRRCADIVQGLLEFGRPSTPSLSEVRLAPLVDETVRLLSRKAKESKVSLVAHTGDAIPPVAADARQIQQVMVNLILNALQASPANTTVEVSLRCGPGDKVLCRVQDRGGGVEKDRIPRIFEPFYTTKAEHQGMGLGLSVSHRIIQCHGGEMGAHPREGGGLVVWFAIPALKTVPQPAGRSHD